MSQMNRHCVEWYDPPQKNIIVNYFRTTGIHGLQYLGQPKLHLIERLLWLAAFTIAASVSTVLISQMWVRYRTLPIVTVLNPIELSLKEIPFPAVTICNVNDVTKTKAGEYLLKLMEVEENVNATKDEKVQAYAKALDLKRICETAKRFTTAFYDKKTTEHVLTTFLGKNLTHKIINIRNDPNANEIYNLTNPVKMVDEDSQPCDKMILLCIWLNQIHNCSDLFQQVSTDFGVCCTFNMIPKSLLRRFSDENLQNEAASEWKDSHLSMEKMIFTEETKNRKYPRRQLHAGRTSGLSFLLDPDLDEYFCPNLDSVGFVLNLHSPLDMPRMRENGIVIGAQSEVFVGVKPEITIADDSIVSFEPKRRHCYLNKEMRLAHFSKYSESNCIDECVANLTKAQCCCVEFYMPHGPKDLLCSTEDENCTSSVTENITRVGLGQACDICLPTCTEIHYETDTTSQNTRFESAQQLLIKYPQFSSIDLEQVTIVHIYFTEDGVYPRLRKEQFGVVDLLSNSGGLLGLCLGFSGLSLLELVYHFTIRVCFKNYRKRVLGPETDGAVQNNDDINTNLKEFSKNMNKNISELPTINYVNDDNLFNIVHKSKKSPIPNTYRTLFESDFKTRIK